ncbi:MAG: hypothetical protein OXF31_12455 [Gammaproteobacteria bacterium]|nr:hypothetical protein [Gammaproteobacteria bacterium]
MATHDPWHFSRDAFALDLVKHLYMGLASRLTLVAPRRKGKTEFLSGLRSRMSPLDQAVFLEVARNPEIGGLHSQRFLEDLEHVVGKRVTRANVGRRLQRLVEQNLISVVRRGQYQVEMPGFAEWLLGQEQPEQTQGSVG